jgi:TetR/AcrR family transcriptional regulator, transcriptional repressor of aconitase
MPKVSAEHKEARREQILAGAQRAFARYGYEGATVARLEQETRLSRGAIFNYFENKEALFVALVRRSSDRFVEIWLEQGYRALLEAVTQEDPEWLSVQIEAARRVRTDERFREQLSRLEDDVVERREERHARLQDMTRGDVPIQAIAQFLGMLANGVAFARVTDDPMPDLDQLMTLIETGVGPR